MNSSSLRVSAADKVHNGYAILRDLRNIGDETWVRFNAPPDDILAYYQSLVKSYREAGGGRLVDELDRIVRAIEREWATRGSRGLAELEPLKVLEHAFAVHDLPPGRRRASVRLRPDGWLSRRTSLGFRRNGKRITMFATLAGWRDRAGHRAPKSWSRCRLAPTPKPAAFAMPPRAARTGSNGALT